MKFYSRLVVALVTMCLVMTMSTVVYASQTSDNFSYVLNAAFEDPSELIDTNLTKMGRKSGLTFYNGNYKNIGIILGVNSDGVVRCAQINAPDYTNFKEIAPLVIDRFGEPQQRVSGGISIIMDYEWRSSDYYISLLAEKPSNYGWNNQVSFQMNLGFLQ